MRVNDTGKRRYYTLRRWTSHACYYAEDRADELEVTWKDLEETELKGAWPDRIGNFFDLEVGQQIEGYHYDTIIRLKDAK